MRRGTRDRRPACAADSRSLKFAAAGSASPDPDRPELFTALQEQLGLKLEARREPVDVLVIDRAEKPEPN